MTRIIYKNRWGVECEVDASEVVSVEGFAKAAEGDGSSQGSSAAEVFAPLPCRPEGPFSAGWRTIDSAPRDGTHILVTEAHRGGLGACGPLNEHGYRSPADWCDVVHWYDNPSGPGFYSTSWGGDQEQPFSNLTHWMPLPPCPAESGGSGGEAVGPSPGPVTPSELTEIARLSQQVKTLERDRDELRTVAAYRFDRAEAAELQLSKAEAQMKGMREALKLAAQQCRNMASQPRLARSQYREAFAEIAVDLSVALQPQEGKE